MTLLLALLVGAGAAAWAQPAKPLRLIGNSTQLMVQTESGPLLVTRSPTPLTPSKGVLQALVPVPGVQPVTEIEVLQALNDPGVMLLDMRDEDGPPLPTIPNAYQMPYAEVEDRLDELGCTRQSDRRWDCAQALRVIAFCFGPMCVQSPAGMARMVQAGFPADKIGYYRGGMMDWQALGLTTVTGYRQPRR